MIRSWIKKAWLGKRQTNIPKENHPCITSQDNRKYNTEFYTNFYSLIAQGARLKMVEAMFNLKLFDLFKNEACISEHEIIQKLQLMPIRAKKWLHLLSCEHFLIKITQDGQTTYSLPAEFIQLINSDRWWGMQFFFSTWMHAANENLTDVLAFGKVKTRVSWPPKTDSEVVWLENWMSQSADPYINTLLNLINFKKVNSFLDVGGGDGTMACAFAKAHPHLKGSIYNLPKAAQMARRTIASRELDDRVSVIEGNFIEEDAFPLGFDLILFIRVLFDWDEKTNKKLLKMAYQALPKNGLIAICEFYKENNHDRCLAAEYRYIFHDDFSAHVMKSKAEYQSMLEETGFTLTYLDQQHLPYCSLILARK